MMRRLLQRHRPHAVALALATVLMVLASAVPAALVVLVQQVVDRLLVQRQGAALALVPFAVAALYLLNGVLRVSRAWITRRVSLQVVAELRRDLFARLLELPPAWHQGRPLGQRLSWLEHHAGQVRYLVSAWCTVVERPLTLLGLVATAFWMDWRLATAGLLVLPLVAWPISAFGRRLRQSARDSLASQDALTAVAQESLAGVRVLQAFGAERSRLARFEEENREQVRLQLRTTLAQLLPGPAIELIAAVAVGLVLAYGGARVFAGDLEPGELVAFLVAMGLMNLPLKSLSEVVSLTQRALAGAEQVFAVLDQAPASPSQGRELRADAVRLVFDEVEVDYGDGPVVRRLSFVVEPGERVALVGASGAGKSSVLGLLPRFVQASGGRVLLNGHALEDWSLASLRAHVAVVGQEPFLFSGSVLDNVRLGRPGASREEVVAACVAAEADAFVRELPRGYDTPLDEAGARLSGGERQRLCIARALLVDAPLLLLDEATSSLDSVNAAQVRRALARLAQGRTTLEVAHRLDAIQDADRILVLRDGLLVEVGRHAELVQRGGEYSRLYGEGV